MLVSYHSCITGLTTASRKLHHPVMAQPVGPVRAVILDLDGTLLDTESLCISVSKQVLAAEGYNVTLTPEACKACMGKRPVEAWTGLVEALQLHLLPQRGAAAGDPAPTASALGLKLMNTSEPLLQARWGEARLLPGALRLVRHLAQHQVPYAVATSTPRATLNAKLSTKPELQQLVQLAVCGDEVVNGKPAPDTFLAAARLLGIPAGLEHTCLVVEDTLAGVQGAAAAGMQVVMVPSLREQAGSEPEGVRLLPSLLDLPLHEYGIPAFDGMVHGTIPLDTPIHIKGQVVRGFGRGSKELGIPTANVCGDVLVDCLADAVTGIYCGWASIGTSKQVHKMVMSIGYNPFFNNSKKTAEPWILSDFPHSFYGQEIRLVVAAYIRPEANFTSLQALINRIQEDANVTRQALDNPVLAAHSTDVWLLPGHSAASLAAEAAASGAADGTLQELKNGYELKQ